MTYHDNDRVNMCSNCGNVSHNRRCRFCASERHIVMDWRQARDMQINNALRQPVNMIKSGALAAAMRD